VSSSTISKCVSAAGSLIGYFSHSALATVKLEKQQEQMAINSENATLPRLLSGSNWIGTYPTTLMWLLDVRTHLNEHDIG